MALLQYFTCFIYQLLLLLLLAKLLFIFVLHIFCIGIKLFIHNVN